MAIKKRSLVDQVYECCAAISSRCGALGSKLNVNELQDELGVSCTPVPEAVNRLRQEGTGGLREQRGRPHPGLGPA